MKTPELLVQPAVCQRPLCTRDSLNECLTEDMCLRYKARVGETIQYVDIMSLYPYICKYFKFPVAHPVSHEGDASKDKEVFLRMDGLIKYTILSPERLYHLVLPFRSN